ncbi:MAG: type secretion exporter [Bryobacterales bacterium]|nr:type secretion exporter [Bryobacterales bacterium]
MSAANGQQTEKATPRRLEKARKEGQFPTAKDLVASAQFAVFVALLGSCFAKWFAQYRIGTRVLLERAFHTELTVASLVSISWWIAANHLLPLAAMGAALVLTVFAAQMMVTQFGFSLSKLTPDFGRLSPLSKLKEIPRQNFPALLQALIMLPLVGYTVWLVAKEKADDALLLPMGSVESGAAAVGASLRHLLWRAAGLFIVFGLINFVRQRRQFSNDLKMSKQEIRDEAKESEGNPQMKQRVRRIQRDMRRRHMMKDVPTATAVVVNPTHFAVAIRYSMESMAAPTVVAKGKNYLALRIRQLAIENQVPIIENPPLAQALYKSVDVGQEIPAHLYRAVAEILAYIYKIMNGRLPR